MDYEITISLLDEKTLEQQVQVYLSAFESTSNLEESIKQWRKKHYENPLGKSLIVGAYINGQLVGINAYLPVIYCINGEHIRMLQSCESGVLPSCQGKGIWKKIVTFAIAYIENETNYELVIGFPNYKNSYPGFRKMGWKTLCNMENAIMVNNISAFKNVFSHNNWLRRILLNVIALQRTGISLNESKKYHIEKTSIHNLLWNDNQAYMTCSHDRELLEWKKEYKHLYSVCIKNGNEIVATCIYELSSYQGGHIIKLERFEYQSNFTREANKILASLLKYLSENHPDAAFVRVWTQKSTQMNRLLKKLLFFSSSHPNPFIVHNPQSKYVNVQWSLSFFDLD